ncbi:glycosyltransferase family 4 protein [Mucilaginibacter dorajii]|uniref:Glycosyl transferase family 1 domain-containing protein n=1 Tax=Mucilaginibacter dorajii TaxID=692994 RepID=A0ABP7R8Z1_9SPHI|nr:glycosyltransferase [Mucilaginibacter dorajii]MCS3737363.1 glycosyltransferase involved in cell wall biosynthesis [Mucilaginibacter dorajii]
MIKPKALIILSPGFPADGDDTACLPLQQIFVRTLQQDNPELNIMVISFQYPFKASRYFWYGAEIIALAGKGRGRIYRLLTWQRAFKALKKIARDYEITGLLSFWMGECALVANKFAKRNNLLHYCWLLGQDAKAGNHYVDQVRPMPGSVIALSDFLAKEFYLNYNIKPRHVIPVGIDTSIFEKNARARDIDIMGAGSLIPLKQYSLFINVIKSIANDFPDIKAVICGKGPEMENLQNQINRLGLENNVELKGELPHRQVLALMQRSKVLLHTSNYEGYGVVLNEALYAGAHVVSLVKPMDVRPAQHHIPDNAEDLPAMIAALLHDKSLKHQPVLVNSMQGIARQVASLFVS